MHVETPSAEAQGDAILGSTSQVDAETIERLDEQSELLLRIYRAELAKDPSSRATESSRSNMIALRHSIDQIYGEAASPGLPFQANPERETTP
jgi:hypothetical protein